MQDTDQDEPPGSEGGRVEGREKRGELRLTIDRAEPITQIYRQAAFAKSGARNAGGIGKDRAARWPLRSAKSSTRLVRP